MLRASSRTLINTTLSEPQSEEIVEYFQTLARKSSSSVSLIQRSVSNYNDLFKAGQPGIASLIKSGDVCNDDTGNAVPVAKLLTTLSITEMSLVLVELGLVQFAGTYDDAAQILLLSYLYGVLKNDEWTDRLRFFSRIQLSTLVRSIPPWLRENEDILTDSVMDDYPDLLWILATWSPSPLHPIQNTRLYNERCQMDGDLAFKIAKYLYDYQDETPEIPWRFITREGRSILEPLVINSEPNSDFLVFPSHINTHDARERYFHTNLHFYELTFRRSLRPFPLVGEQLRTVEAARKTLYLFTDPELIGMFRLGHRNWFSRHDLIDQTARLAISQKEAWKADGMNLIYGTIYGSRLYSSQELETSFASGNFTNPNDPMTDPLRTFSIEAMTELRDLLRSLPRFARLLQIVETNLQTALTDALYLHNLESRIQSFNNIEIGQISEFLFQFFVLSMSARYWKGAPHVYPYLFTSNLDNPHQTNEPHRRETCEILSKKIKDDLASYSQDIQDLIGQNVALNYDWISGSTRTIDMSLLDLLGDLNQLGELGLQSSYALLTQVFHLSNSDLNLRLRLYFENPHQPDFVPTHVNVVNHLDLPLNT